ncbi:cell wall integrity and stress response component 3-like isoform X3 [Cotesia glomerata]|uniref:cell wall integrity and stress response component 3-like isoform X3 n=1 Tax=Cotesia glomerata TaxID=32391 RepID=UPI001D02A48C|nr:cell wall integrity and stress response component 3-like isoform X3 [Cotesia glomerata]
MFNSRINLNSLVFISLFITCNVHKGTSLQCYQCESNSDGECWSDLSTTLLVTCGDENSTTPNPLTNLTTIASTTESTTSFTTTSTTESTTPSTTAPTTEYTTFSTTESTTPSTTASTTESTTSSTTNSTSVTRIASDKSRFRRSVDLRADGAWECIKHIKKEGDEEIVNRKCAKTSEKFCNDKAENSCFVCSDKDACNSASNIGFQIIFMTLPLTVVFFFSTIIPSYLSM